MMPSLGFFVRSELREKPAGRKTSGLSDERLHELGLEGVKRMNPQARSHNMKPSGSDRPDIYVLGEGPNREEDKQGRPFVGPSGQLLRKHLFEEVRIRINNVVRTLPIRRNGTLKPTRHEIECFRPSLEQDIAQAKPKIILALGDTAAFWCIGQMKHVTISTIRGRRFPVEIGGHQCWCYCAHHPAYILRVLSSSEYAQIPGSEHEKYFINDIERAFSDLGNLREPQIEDIANLDRGIHLETKSMEAIGNFLAKLRLDRKTVGIDLETNCKRPYSPGAKILTMAVGTGKEVLAFPIDHPQASWTKEHKRKLDLIVHKFLIGDNDKVCHFTSFDLEWMAWKWGVEVLYESFWHDTADQAYLLDERKGGLSLNFLNVLHFGLKLKAQSSGSAAEWFSLSGHDDGEIDRKKLEQTNLTDVLWYNGRDTKYTHKLFVRQKGLLKATGSWEVYREHVSRVPSIVRAQLEGIPIDQQEVAKNREEMKIKSVDVVKQVEECDAVKRYNKKFGTFSPTSPQDCAKLFRDVLGRTEGRRGTKYSTDEEALSKMTDEPIAKLILELRGYDKLRGTYVERMSTSHPQSWVFPDGRLHCLFKYLATDTTRLASSEPNNQNWPSRTDRWIRKEVCAPPGHVMVAVDQGQLEYRVLGMITHDKTIVRSLYDDYDVHRVWAEKIAKIYPKIIRDRHGDKKPEDAIVAFRGELKTDVIFPWFYMASLGLAARALDNMPVRKLEPIWDEFWETFGGVRKWQKMEVEFYHEHGYVESLFKIRRHGPMSVKQICNAPVQCDAANMVIWSMNRLNRIAYETERPWLAPVLTIHDDNTFFVPKKKVDEAVPIIVREMCCVPFEFVNVPLSVEVKVGPNWGELSKFGVFRSDKLDGKVASNKRF